MKYKEVLADINRYQSQVESFFTPRPAPRTDVPKRWPIITSELPPQKDTLETAEPTRKAPDAVVAAPTNPAPSAPSAPTASSAKTGINLRSAPAKRSAPGESCADVTTKFIRDNQEALSGDMSPQQRDKLANALRKLPGFARMQDEMASPRNRAAVARGVDWNAGTSEGRAATGRNFYSVLQHATATARNARAN